VTTVPEPDRRAEGAAWALTLLVTLSSVAFAAGAVAGWRVNLWPATPVTFGIAAGVVLAGPALAAALSLAVRRGSTVAAPAPVAAPAQHVMRTAPPTRPQEVRAQRAQALLDWRDAPRSRTRASA
jgi:hypothetical protein